MMVQWTVTMATRIPPDKLARVSSYDALGSVMAMPVGALVAGPIAAGIGVSAAQYGAAALIVIATALALIPRDVRRMRANPAGLPHRGLPHRGLAGGELADGELGGRELAGGELAGQATSSASPVNVTHISA
jgi:hypothetical protein